MVKAFRLYKANKCTLQTIIGYHQADTVVNFDKRKHSI